MHWITCKKRCQTGGCARCKYYVLSPQWKPRLLIDQTKPHLGSWLGCAVSQNKWYARCRICHPHTKHDTATRWSTTTALQIMNLLNHHNSLKHRTHCAELLGKPLPKGPALAPSADRFRMVIDHRWRGGSLKQGVPGVWSWFKCVRLQYCMAEGRRDKERAFLRKAAGIALHPDGRKKAASRPLRRMPTVFGNV